MPPRPNKKATPNSKKPPKKPSIDRKEPAPTTFLDTSNTIPLPLQQLLLNIFQSALLPNTLPSSSSQQTPTQETKEGEENQLDLKPLIQTIKSHLYNRDFDSAFTDADEELLRAYALRWSATRALGYAGVFKAVLKLLDFGQSLSDDRGTKGKQIVCIGGGAGAEIVALGGAWRDLTASISTNSEEEGGEGEGKVGLDKVDLTVTAVDIADWSSVVDRLDTTMRSSRVSSLKSHPAPLIQQQQQPPSMKETDNGEDNKSNGKFNVNFHRADILTLPENDLAHLYNPQQKTDTVMVTLMFTLNELFSTSMAKATGFLLRTTDAVQPGTLLLVVDSPGSYSSLKLGGGTKTGTERQYPMKFLLDHTLLTVATGKWERVLSQDSRWWRRDASRLCHDVGEGAGLEDMRFQVHLYRRL